MLSVAIISKLGVVLTITFRGLTEEESRWLRHISFSWCGFGSHSLIYWLSYDYMYGKFLDISLLPSLTFLFPSLTFKKKSSERLSNNLENNWLCFCFNMLVVLIKGIELNYIGIFLQH
ncbi:hypothetical protein Leryth_014478 [Lithospermum erythrorhizon]|nr:hypothetical protein Leryth_014478 [Lithospermum erythrorhizon]